MDKLLLFHFIKDWVGVGFSDYGSVEGADLCALWRDWRGNLFFSDIHVTEVSAPESRG